MRRWGKGLLALAAMMSISGSAAAQDEAGFQVYLQGVAAKARSQGVSERAISAVLGGLTYNPRVVELDRGQPGGTSNSVPAFAPYKARHVDAARINRGREAYRAQRPKLMRIEQETGVPESIMVAIWGHETNYGGYTGNFDLPRSLATLAFEGRRRALFEPELIATMKMVDRGVPRDSLKGSWAGATGYPQFLPSIYLRLARDGDGDGRADIWTSAADALASIGNYFVNAGWRPGQPWGIAVNVPATLNRGPLTSPTRSPRCPRVHERHTRWRSMAEWRRLGIVPQSGRWPDDNVQATLLEPDGPGNTAYLLTGNYRVILDYNCSNFYALSVGLLADEVAR
ncbi:lytic murein transglycosylase [Sphingomonas desiccabilis]|uniref:Lytic murein transglycosylase n=1 Tax=Sphingomonas desiccabilis TaxID=429134 RepID=A0A4Q2IXT2_9SPHN|nr:lytic murein transglycosylase [Sphingomonas desiccabilis]MBB3910683.1 lytic murein transglycosylase [Sphingomonas desiccabilis]RXZ35306.1 lytic murein transglycosylase [Sphingomonas desiccabilis]